MNLAELMAAFLGILAVIVAFPHLDQHRWRRISLFVDSNVTQAWARSGHGHSYLVDGILRQVYRACWDGRLVVSVNRVDTTENPADPFSRLPPAALLVRHRSPPQPNLTGVYDWTITPMGCIIPGQDYGF